MVYKIGGNLLVFAHKNSHKLTGFPFVLKLITLNDLEAWTVRGGPGPITLQSLKLDQTYGDKNLAQRIYML